MTRDFFATLWRLVKSLEHYAPDTQLAHFTAMHCHASVAGRYLRANDCYGRSLGMAYWDTGSDPFHRHGTATLLYVVSMPGQGRLLMARLLARLAVDGVQSVHVPLRRKQVAERPNVFSVSRATLKLQCPTEPVARAELHPLLVERSARSVAEAANAGAALYVLSHVPRLASATARACAQLIDRASGAGHLRVIYDAEQRPVGVVVWARPRYADLGRLWQPKEVGRLHACELNMGGDLALLEYAVSHPNAVEGLLDVVRSELAQDGGALHLLLQRAGNGQAQGELLSIGRDDLPSFLDWFGKQLTEQAAQARQPSC